MILCIPELPSVPAFRSSYLTCMALLTVLKQANLILMPCQSYLRFESVMFGLDLTENISNFLFFPLSTLDFSLHLTFQDSSKCTKCWNETPEPAAQASLRLLECWPVMSWFDSVASFVGVLSPANPCRRSQRSLDRASSGSWSPQLLQTSPFHILKHRGWSWTLRPGDIFSFDLPHLGTAKILHR